MVTAEMAAALPVLALIVATALVAVSVAGQRVRAQDAAREAARAAARGDMAAAQRLAQQVGPAGASILLGRSGQDVTARVTAPIHPLASWLPSFTVTETAVAAVEPGTGSGLPP